MPTTCEGLPRCVNAGRTIWWFCGDCGRKIPHTEQTLCWMHMASEPYRHCGRHTWAQVRMYDPDDPATIEEWLTTTPVLGGP